MLIARAAGLSHAEIADRRGMTATAVMMALSRARSRVRRLRAQLVALVPGPSSLLRRRNGVAARIMVLPHVGAFAGNPAPVLLACAITVNAAAGAMHQPAPGIGRVVGPARRAAPAAAATVLAVDHPGGDQGSAHVGGPSRGPAPGLAPAGDLVRARAAAAGREISAYLGRSDAAGRARGASAPQATPGGASSSVGGATAALLGSDPR